MKDNNSFRSRMINDNEALVATFDWATKLDVGEEALQTAKGHFQILVDESIKTRRVEDEMLGTDIEKVVKRHPTKLLKLSWEQAEQVLTTAVNEECLEALAVAILNAEACLYECEGEAGKITSEG